MNNNFLEKVFFNILGFFLFMIGCIVLMQEYNKPYYDCNLVTLQQYINNDVTAQCYPIVEQNFKPYAN